MLKLFLLSPNSPEEGRDSVLILQAVCKGSHWTSVGACMRNWPKWGGWDTHNIDVALGPFEGICRQGVARGSWVGSFMNSVSHLVRSTALRWFGAIITLLPAHSDPQPCLSLQYSRWGKKEVDFLGNILLGSRNQVLIQYIFIFPVEEIAGWWGFSWHWAVLSWGMDVSSKVKLFFFLFTLFNASILSLFLQQCIGTSLMDSWTTIKVYSSMDSCQDQCFMGGWW